MKTIFNSTTNRLMSIKNNISKNMMLFILAAFAVMITSCNDDLEVEKTPDATTYNTAEGIYGGDLLGNGNAFFILDLYNSSNPNIGIFIMGFCTLPNNIANFKLDAGTYHPASNGAVKTFLPGSISEGIRIGVYQYNFTTKKFTFITGGSFTVSLSGNTYTIKTDFTGKDADTGDEVKNIRINYTGAIGFDYSSESIVKSTYKATGTPKWLIKDPGDNTWTGMLEPDDTRLEITNWGNDDISIYCDYVDESIMIDNYTRVAFNDTYNGYFRVAYNDGENLNLLPEKDYIVSYNPSTNILDFTGTVTDGGKTYEALVGIAAYDKTTGNAESVFTDFYAGVKLQLTPVSTSGSKAVRQSNSLVETSGIMNLAKGDLMNEVNNLMRGVSKPQTIRKATNIEVDKLDKTKIQKIPLKDLKKVDSNQ